MGVSVKDWKNGAGVGVGWGQRGVKHNGAGRSLGKLADGGGQSGR